MGYFKEARARAQRRRSPWNLLLIPAVLGTWLLTWLSSAWALGKLLRLARPGLEFVFLPDSGGGILMVLGLLAAWLPLAMIVGNLLVAAVPPARRALDLEASTVPGTDFSSANKDLLKVAIFLTPAGLVVALLGALVA